MQSPRTFSQTKDHQVVKIQISSFQSPREQKVYMGVSIGNVGSGAGATAFFLISSSHCFIFLFILFHLFIWSCHVACRTLVPQPGIKPKPPAVEAQSPNHWTAGSPSVSFLCQVYSGIQTRSQRVYAVPGYCRARDWANQTATCLMCAQKHCP